MAFMAGDVKLIEGLKQPLGGYATAAKGSLQDALGRISSRSKQSQEASGRVTGEYTGQQLGQAGMMGERGIDDALGGVLGDASYTDALNQKKFEQDMMLAKRVGALNRPSTIMQVIQGLGGAVDTGFQAKGLYDALNKQPRSSGNVQYGISQNPFSTDDALSRISGTYPNKNSLMYAGR